MIGRKKPKDLKCASCGSEFTDLDTERICSNCFACTGCEIYRCPFCGKEVVIREMKKMKS